MLHLRENVSQHTVPNNHARPPITLPATSIRPLSTSPFILLSSPTMPPQSVLFSPTRDHLTSLHHPRPILHRLYCHSHPPSNLNNSIPPLSPPHSPLHSPPRPSISIPSLFTLPHTHSILPFLRPYSPRRPKTLVSGPGELPECVPKAKNLCFRSWWPSGAAGRTKNDEIVLRAALRGS